LLEDKFSDFLFIAFSAIVDELAERLTEYVLPGSFAKKKKTIII
jgi:hypothetical protein